MRLLLLTLTLVLVYENYAQCFRIKLHHPNILDLYEASLEATSVCGYPT
jgi:hypothetical protein